MSSGNSGAVFFLGTRAHYQVLQQPQSRGSYDVENGNASTETIYQNPSTVQEIWNNDANVNIQKNEIENSGKWEKTNWNYEQTDGTGSDEKLEVCTGVKRRTKRRSSETALCERDGELRPAQLNNLADCDKQKPKPSRRRNLLAFLSSLKRKRRLDTDQIQYLKHLESALMTCTYRESCRCFECQSRYFECDDSEESGSDEYAYTYEYSPQYASCPPAPAQAQGCEQCGHYDDDDDEVFVDTVPSDNASTDLLIEDKEKMSISSDDVVEAEKPEDNLELEVAAGTPVILNYLLTHPITCTIQ